MGNSAIGSGDTEYETGEGLDGKRPSKKSGDRSEIRELVKILKDVDQVCSVEKCSPKFYDLKIYGKTHVQCIKKAHVQRQHETTQNLPLNVVYRFLDFVITDS
ncbi:hypothetical protein G5I_00447 [Acromyrmex echinatior]|uniref:Uncharacterized protein n=1 Tax=Acromyrmex echinatior TaxID=103372 RepID=F4W4W6_ACREC|nr:hypothetical protein G5I_00447 [Acromyrmex echinatior]